ncbi:MAG: hypothetical protein FWD76_06410 [Firmicutes bacterium]|nr:hypothetical protein [Bacillota bacterium]
MKTQKILWSLANLLVVLAYIGVLLWQILDGSATVTIVLVLSFVGFAVNMSATLSLVRMCEKNNDKESNMTK